MQTALVLGHALCLFVSAFLLDRLLPHLEKPGMSKRKALDCLGLAVFLLIATGIAACGVYVGGRLLYGHLLSLPGAPILPRSGAGGVFGHLMLLCGVYYMAWSLLRTPRLIEEMERTTERATRWRNGPD
ncbi:MAG: hypothetical protein ACIAQU_09785 [Phycisphaerales bacterium JB064]